MAIARTMQILALTLVLQAASGCGLITIGRVTINDVIQPEDLAFLELGHTPLKAVTERLGAPEELIGTQTGGVAIYRFRDAKFSRFDFGWIVRFFSPAKPELVLSGAGLGTDQLLVTFDTEWIVRSASFGHHAGAAGYLPKPL